VIGKIPILNQLLLGTDANLVAAYFQVTGPWDDPEVKPILLPGSAGPTSVVLQGVPLFVKRGFQALGSLILPEPSQAVAPPPANTAGPPEEAAGASAPPANPSSESAGSSAGSATPSVEPTSPSSEPAGPSEDRS